MFSTPEVFERLALYSVIYGLVILGNFIYGFYVTLSQEMNIRSLTCLPSSFCVTFLNDYLVLLNVIESVHLSFISTSLYVLIIMFQQSRNYAHQTYYTERLNNKLQLMVRGSGIRDIAEVERISIGKVLRTLTESTYQIQPKQSHYESLEVDEFWTFVGNKNNKQWLIYAYHRETGEIVAYVWGKRDLATVQRLKTKLKQLGIHYTRIASDHWDSFITAFKTASKVLVFYCRY